MSHGPALLLQAAFPVKTPLHLKQQINLPLPIKQRQPNQSINRWKKSWLKGKRIYEEAKAKKIAEAAAAKAQAVERAKEAHKAAVEKAIAERKAKQEAARKEKEAEDRIAEEKRNR